MDKGKPREPHEGNTLWALYHELGTVDKRAFREYFAATGYRWETFLRDSMPDRLLADVTAGRLLAYNLFFPDAGLLVAALPSALRPPSAAAPAKRLDIFQAAVTDSTN